MENELLQQQLDNLICRMSFWILGRTTERRMSRALQCHFVSTSYKIMIHHSEHSSQFKDVWDVDYFITSLSDEVRIVGHLPPKLRKMIQKHGVYSMPPVSWSNMSYYYNTVS
ncbi:hypothetical protein COLO4_19222 [Corchorus olitorius]|uniref:Uncharacterized protein n=1 Tax=Corchorus olitorius TaxID=93759 RepID=A0A1R3J6A7_9ROSI|nr:hypothetical protein COLO4_19222 [Corchorus olitorius]